MKILKTSITSDSVLYSSLDRYHYIDSFKASLHDTKDTINVSSVAKAFFISSPKWIGQMLQLRNQIVSRFGLKTEGSELSKEELLANFSCEPGDQVGLFKVFEKTNNEVVLGEDDKHLDFRVSLFLTPLHKNSTKKDLTISTTVIFHNWMGRLYFLPVKPFHRIVVPTMLKAIVKELEKTV